MIQSSKSSLYSVDTNFRTEFNVLYQDSREKFLNENDLEIALFDYDAIFSSNISDSYLQLKEDLNWFQTVSLNPYMDSLESFATYTKYIILLKVFNDRTYVLQELENYFVDQLYSYIKTKKILEKDSIKTLAKYANNLRDEITYFDTLIKKYKYFQSSFDFYFNNSANPKTLYRFIIPVIVYNTLEEVSLILLQPYYNKVPNWFSIPSIYKYYKYFASIGIVVKKVYFNWYDMTDFFKNPVRIEIPTTENVAKMVSIYSDVMPFQHPSIFDNKSKYRYHITPLRNLVKNYK